MGIKVNKKDLKLIISGFLTLLCLIGILTFAISFIVKISHRILGAGQDFQPAAEKFNLEGLKEINEKLPADLKI